MRKRRAYEKPVFLCFIIPLYRCSLPKDIEIPDGTAHIRNSFVTNFAINIFNTFA